MSLPAFRPWPQHWITFLDPWVHDFIQYCQEKSKDPPIDTLQEVNGGQSWLSPPLPMAPKHCKTSIFGAMIVPEREVLEPH